MENWAKGVLGDFVTLQRGIDLPEYERKEGNVPVVTSAGISGFHDEAKAKAPGVVMGRYGTLGAIYYLTEDYWPHNTTLYAKDFKGNDPRFFSYFLRTLDYQAHNDKSSVPGLNRNHLHIIPVEIPPLIEQRSIADVLGSFDDKIELNRRMNQTLEALARALFKAWFVDFDPVRAKAEGRAPAGMDAETAALFPSAFDGDIPQGWKLVKLSAICTTQYGYTASASDKPVGPKFLRITDMNKEPWIDWANIPYCSVSDKDFAKYKLELGDVLVSRMADPGKAGIVEEEIASVFASYLVRLKFQSLAWAYFGFYFLRSDQYLEYTDGAKSGSVQSGMNAKVIVDANLSIPNELIVNAFLRTIQPLRQKISVNLQESRTLAALRDALLPRLLSGEIRVKGAE